MTSVVFGSVLDNFYTPSGSHGSTNGFSPVAVVGEVALIVFVVRVD